MFILQIKGVLPVLFSKLCAMNSSHFQCLSVFLCTPVFCLFICPCVAVFSLYSLLICVPCVSFVLRGSSFVPSFSSTFLCLLFVSSILDSELQLVMKSGFLCFKLPASVSEFGSFLIYLTYIVLLTQLHLFNRRSYTYFTITCLISV